jgi:hypothetical protein
MDRSAKIVIMGLMLALALPSLAAAQATRTWVSGVGDDANPCSRTAPCKTFAGAISRTAAGGEISVLDPGGFGAVTITKSLTINGDGGLASILVSGTPAIQIAAGSSDVVILRNLSLQGVGGGTDGIRYLSGGHLVVENLSISNFTGSGIVASVTGNGNLAVRNTSITGGTTGIVVNCSGTMRATLTGVSIVGTVHGIDAYVGATDVNNSSISQVSGFALIAEGGVLTAENMTLTGNAIAAQAQTGATLQISNSGIYANLTAFGCGGGIIVSSHDNRVLANGGGAPSCLPNATATIQ